MFRKKLSTMKVVVPGFVVGYSRVVSPPVFREIFLFILAAHRSKIGLNSATGENVATLEENLRFSQIF